MRVVNVYVVNGQVVGSEKYAAKLEWMRRLRAYLDRRHRTSEPLVLCGDFNVAPEARDVDRPEVWASSVLFHPEVREALRHIAAFGLEDTLRLHTQEAGLYSWWDYRKLSFPEERRAAARPHLATPPVARTCTAASIDRNERKGQQPSDHAPVLATFDLPVVAPDLRRSPWSARGAAGLMAAIWAGRAGGRRVVLARRRADAGGQDPRSPAAGAATSPTTRWTRPRSPARRPPPSARCCGVSTCRRRSRSSRELGVALKREETGKLFPVTDRARTVLDALLEAAHIAGVEIVHPWRVAEVSRDAGRLHARGLGRAAASRRERVVLATGGKSIPKSGSDGAGYGLRDEARPLDHRPRPSRAGAAAPRRTDTSCAG